MCFRDVLGVLRAEGLNVSIMKLRWAIDSGKIPTPPRDGSNRFVFEEQQLSELRRYFQSRTNVRRSCELVA